VGSVSYTYDSNTQIKATSLATLNYRHEGGPWGLAADLSFSHAAYDTRNLQDGFFTNAVTTPKTGLVLRMEGLEGLYDQKVPVATAVDARGVPVDIYSPTGISLTSASWTAPKRDQNILNAGLNLTREFSLRVPLKFKIGWVMERQERHISTDGVTY